MRNQIIDIELLKLPSIGHDEGVPFISTRPIIQSSKGNSQGPSIELKSDANLQLNYHLNNTKADNLPPLQELSVFEQSFETRRKQIVNQPFRSRSKNYRHFEGGSYTASTNKGGNKARPQYASKDEAGVRERSDDSKSDRRIETEVIDPKLGRKAIMKAINSKKIIIDSSTSTASK